MGGRGGTCFTTQIRHRNRKVRRMERKKIEKKNKKKYIVFKTRKERFDENFSAKRLIRFVRMECFG